MKPAQHSNKAVSNAQSTVCAGKPAGKCSLNYSVLWQGKGLVSHLAQSTYLWCANETVDFKEHSIIALWKHLHSYPPPFSSCLTVPSFTLSFLLWQDFRYFKDLAHSTAVQTETVRDVRDLRDWSHFLASLWTLCSAGRLTHQEETGVVILQLEGFQQI